MVEGGSVDAVASAPPGALDESTLRDPLEMPVFVASVTLNFLLMAFAITLIFYEPAWIKTHPVLGKDISFLRVLAVTALIGIPLLVLTRNLREASIRGNSVRVSERQFPDIYAVLLAHCKRLGMTEIPELFISSGTIAPFSQAFSSWREDYIVLHQVLFDVDDRKTLDVASFVIAHELGAVRLKQTAVWNEMLLTYVTAIKWFRNPLERVRTFSRDRYGAALSPTGFRGLLINAIGRRLMDHVDIEDYLAQERRYGGFWSHLGFFVEPRPQVFMRLKRLHAAGYRYRPREDAPPVNR